MTDYLEELLDQLEEEEAGVAARWPETRVPTPAALSGGTELRETEFTGLRSAAELEADGMELPQEVWMETISTLGAEGVVLNADLIGNGAAVRLPVLLEDHTTGLLVPGDRHAAWAAPQPAALEEAAGQRASRPALLKRAERLERMVQQAQREGGAVRSTGMSEGGMDLPHRAGRQPGGWPERGEDHAAAVDRAFQRDSRRYDQGFSLY